MIDVLCAMPKNNQRQYNNYEEQHHSGKNWAPAEQKEGLMEQPSSPAGV